MKKEALSIFLACLLHYTWMFRNEKLHSGRKNIDDFIRLLNGGVADFLSVLENQLRNSMTEKVIKRWSPLSEGNFKVNIDAAFIEGQAALAMVQRNSEGEVLFLASKLETANSPKEAEMKALVWALEIAVSKNWSNLVWSLDAQVVVKEINSNIDPCDWSTRYLILQCRELLCSNGWWLEWNERETNQLADKVAKLTLNSRNVLFFSADDILRSNFPSCLVDVILLDQVGFGSRL